MATAIAGGTASVVGGGKFVNGATTAAFGYLFNQLANQDRPTRDRSVFADQGGWVSVVGWENPNNQRQGYGYRIYIDTAFGQDRYAHMDPLTITVSVGDAVTSGQYLGTYADPPNGIASGPHLHFERRDAAGNPVNPGNVNVVAPGGVRTSGFGPRWHPVFKRNRNHNGVDYVGPLIAY